MVNFALILKQKNRKYSKFLPIPQAWRYLRVTAVQPPRISNHILNSHWLACAAMMAVCSQPMRILLLRYSYRYSYRYMIFLPKNPYT